MNGAITANNGAIGKVTVALPSDEKVTSGVNFGDVNGDGHIDLLIGATDGAYVAYGDGQGAFHANASASNPGAANTASALQLTVASVVGPSRLRCFRFRPAI